MLFHSYESIVVTGQGRPLTSGRIKKFAALDTYERERVLATYARLTTEQATANTHDTRRFYHIDNIGNYICGAGLFIVTARKDPDRG